MIFILATGLFLLFVAIVMQKKGSETKFQLTEVEEFSEEWRRTLEQKVPFYQKLSASKKKQFEHDVQVFLKNVSIIGVETEIDLTDKLLVASGAIIPVLEFPGWEYKNLDEVLIYPDLFNQNFDTQGKDRFVSGMVGTGVLSGKMILSKKSLHLGFDNTTDKKNVAIHEFVHLIDMADDSIDGIPTLLIDKTYTLPWLELIRTKIIEIEKKQSDINPYGATAVHEFFPVAAEYFFERPKLLQKKHPKLYAELDAIFSNSKKNT